MTLHMLDTDTLSLYQPGNSNVASRLFQHPSEELPVTIKNSPRGRVFVSGYHSEG